MTAETYLSPQVYELVTRRDHVIQSVDYLDDQFTINLTVVKERFGTGPTGKEWSIKSDIHSYNSGSQI